jgi:hypothetical protein
MAPKSDFYAVFGTLVCQKLHNLKIICAFGKAKIVMGCPKASF